MIPLAVIGGIVLLLLLSLWGMYNSLVSMRNRALQGLSGIAVQLRRRADLIPNLVEVVKGYAKYESDTLKAVTELRRQLASAPTSAGALGTIAVGLEQVCGKLMAVAEAYPDLKASQNYLNLQEELFETEDQIAAARRIYNGNVTDYNTSLEQFPTNIVGKHFNFTSLSLFSGKVEDEEAPKISGMAAA